MNGTDGYGTAAPADPRALQAALSCAAKACACFRMGLSGIGADALASASQMAVVAFPAGSAGSMALALVLDAVEQGGDAAEFQRIVSQLTGGA